MAYLTEETNQFGRKKLTTISIPSDSKIQYTKGSVITLYKNTFNAGPGNYYSVVPNCVIKSKNKKSYSVTVKEIKNSKKQVVSSTITIDYVVPQDNVLPKHTGDRAIIDFEKRGVKVDTIRISGFYVDTSYVTSTGEARAISVTGDFTAKFEIITKDSSGIIINRLTNLSIPKPSKGQSQGLYSTSLMIPESSSSTTYTVEIIEGINTTLSSNIIELKTINQYGPSGINVSFSAASGSGGGLTVTGTNPVAINGIEVGQPSVIGQGDIAWVITKSGSTKIYVHRPPVLSDKIEYNTLGSSDWTNTVTEDNGGTEIDQTPKIVQTSNTNITMTATNKVLVAGTTNVSPVLNLDNFITTAPPAFDLTVTCNVSDSVVVDLGSENNTISVSSAYMSGGWSTVAAPDSGSLGSYGAYGGGVGVAGVVTYTAPTTSVGTPETTSFTYKVNDGTTDSATKRVTILLNP